VKEEVDECYVFLHSLNVSRLKLKLSQHFD
jgi:hypothetical protein